MDKNKKKIFLTIIVLIVIIVVVSLVLYFTYFKPKNPAPIWTESELFYEVVDAKSPITAKAYKSLKADLAPMPENLSLKIHTVNVGQGDAIIIQFPTGQNMLIDGGDNNNENFEKLKRKIDNLKIKVFDVIVATHSDADHIGSLDKVLEMYEVKNIFMPKLISSYDMPEKEKVKGAISTLQYKEFYDRALGETYIENGVKTSATIKYNTGIFTFSTKYASMVFYCKSESYYSTISNNSKAEAKNSVSPIALLATNSHTAVLTGDATEAEEREFIKTFSGKIDAELLKVGHHGSATSTSAEFLEVVNPKSAVISLGVNNYGHPHQEVLKRLESAGVLNVYQTLILGTISFKFASNGNDVQSENSNTANTLAINFALYFCVVRFGL